MEMGKVLTSIAPATKVARYMRPELHAILLEQLEKCGVEIEFSHEVVEYFENDTCNQAGVVLKDGSRHSADLVIAADGIRSPSWRLVSGRPVAAQPTGNAAFRCAYPIENTLRDPVLAEHFREFEGGRSNLQMWIG